MKPTEMPRKIITPLFVCAFAAAAAAQPLTLHYSSPAQYFEEALVIGNGNIGATIYGGIEADSLSLNDITLWTGEPIGEPFAPNAHTYIPQIRQALEADDYRRADSLQRYVQGPYTQNYQPLGSLKIAYDRPTTAKATDYSRSLNIADAVARTSYTLGSGKFSTEYFASAPDSVIVVHLQSQTPVSATISLTSPLPHSVTAEGSTIVSTGYAAYSSLPNYYKRGEEHHFYHPDRGTRFCTIVKAKNLGKGSVEPLPDGSLRLKGVTDAVLLITNATSFNGFDHNPATQGRDFKAIANSRIKNAAAKSITQLKSSHSKDYKSLFGTVQLDLGTTPDSIAALPTNVQLLRYTDLGEHNPDLEELYFQYGRYLLISCSRTPGVPANLQGLWNEKLLPPWSSNYTTNINVEENYWPAEVTGLGELQATALLPWIDNLSKTGAETAKHYFGVDKGWCLGHNSDIWATTAPVGMGAGSPVWANWNMGGAWLASHIWEHYLFSQDSDALRAHYPALKGAAEFCLEWMVEKDGNLMTSPSTSPENQYRTAQGYQGATLYGGAADLAMIRQCLLDAAEAAKALGEDPDLVARIDDALPRLAPYKIGHKGNLQEWYYDWEDPEPEHRHQSHLYGLYPGRHLSVDETPDLARAAARTLELKGDKTTGWSTGWRVNLLARLRDAEGAYHMYRTLLKYVSPDGYKGADKRTGGGTYPNLLDAHSPFQIDGNFGGTAGVAEMLIQSTPELITLLPALPAQWHSGKASGLRARGGFILSFEWTDGKLTSGTITSPTGGTTRVTHPGGTATLTLAPGQTLPLNF